VSEQKVRILNKMKIKTTISENNNQKKAPVFAFGYAEAWKGSRFLTGLFKMSVFNDKKRVFVQTLNNNKYDVLKLFVTVQPQSFKERLL